MSFYNQRFIGRTFHIDTNCINARNSLDAMNQLEKLNNDGVILLEMPNAAYIEASFSHNNRRTKKANSYTYTLPTNDVRSETIQRKLIEDILFPEGINTKSKENDVKIVFDALKYGAILVTNDGESNRQPKGILGNRTQLKELGLTVLTASEAVTYVRKLIVERDQNVVEQCKKRNIQPPEWVGEDIC